VTKELLEGYFGVKYRPICRDDEAGADCETLYELFRDCGRRLREHGMTPANGGNMSQKVASGGFVITSSGCNLGEVERRELVLVEACSLERQEVEYRGGERPSSEAMLHWLIYRDFPAAGAVLHAHDEVGTSDTTDTRPGLINKGRPDAVARPAEQLNFSASTPVQFAQFADVVAPPAHIAVS
jgi:hypothetical protein